MLSCQQQHQATFDEAPAQAESPPARQRSRVEARPSAPLPSRRKPRDPTVGASSYDVTGGSRSGSGAGCSTDPPRIAGRRGGERRAAPRRLLPRLQQKRGHVQGCPI
eukprot:8197880-Pyramimonas_sp.AAC.1